MDSLSKIVNNMPMPKQIDKEYLAELFSKKEERQSRTRLQRECDRTKIYELHIKKIPIKDMISYPELSHLSVETIRTDLKAIEKKNKNSLSKLSKEKKSEDLGVLELIEKEAWLEWERSKDKKTKEITKSGESDKGVYDESQLIKEDRSGDPRYLDMVLKAISERNKMLGNYAAVKQEHSGKLDLRSISINYNKPISPEQEKVMDKIVIDSESNENNT